ncbi:flagellar motor protein MotB [Sphingomonas baiyangensis]|uniref:Flagellar motor protein MotB n=1 Tax=Sphingomonas baiyangensis TaxID=2572576 RepID=A0A4U1L3B6_9SPHN|nr:flagellar motor protein MotB [Sphingomonas baiyangensis]TKD51162.1 flagellar motor protein MotB [Sphingomonas baiyangensis]
MSLARFDDAAPARAPWLITLADLSLLLVGFFVFLHASRIDDAALAQAIRAGFDAPSAEPAAAAPIALDRAIVRGFAAGSADTPSLAAAIRWARGAGDPRTRITIAGHVDGTATDVDPLTGSAALLASDRARAVAAALVASGAVARDRIVLSADPAPAGRHVTLSIGFAGNRQDAAGHRPPLALSNPRSLP